MQGTIKVTKGQATVFLVGFVMLVCMIIATEMVESAPIKFDTQTWKVEGRATSDLSSLAPPDVVLDGAIDDIFPLTPEPYNKQELATGFGSNGEFRVQNATLTGSEGSGIRRISVEAATAIEIDGTINPSVSLEAEFNGVWTAPSNGFIDFKFYHYVPGFTRINQPGLPHQGEEDPRNAFALVNVIERTEDGLLQTHYTSGLFSFFTHFESHPHTNSFKANKGSKYYFQLMVSVDSEDWNWSALHMEVDFRDVAVYLLADSTPYTPLQIPPTASLISEPGTPWLDADNDGVPDSSDNCPDDANSDQGDLDEDNIGDVCDLDIDGDGYDNDVDNCPLVSNVDQEDTDNDGDGDGCDDDDDDDGVPDVDDNCSLMFNEDQSDTDGDGQGDACDGDLDGDGVDNAIDNCENIANSSQNDLIVTLKVMPVILM